MDLETQKNYLKYSLSKRFISKGIFESKERWILHFRDSDLIKKIVNHEEIFEIANYGVATPDHN